MSGASLEDDNNPILIKMREMEAELAALREAAEVHGREKSRAEKDLRAMTQQAQQSERGFQEAIRNRNENQTELWKLEKELKGGLDQLDREINEDRFIPLAPLASPTEHDELRRTDYWKMIGVQDLASGYLDHPQLTQLIKDALMTDSSCWVDPSCYLWTGRARCTSCIKGSLLCIAARARYHSSCSECGHGVCRVEGGRPTHRVRAAAIKPVYDAELVVDLLARTLSILDPSPKELKQRSDLLEFACIYVRIIGGSWSDVMTAVLAEISSDQANPIAGNERWKYDSRGNVGLQLGYLERAIDAQPADTTSDDDSTNLLIEYRKLRQSLSLKDVEIASLQQERSARTGSTGRPRIEDEAASIAALEAEMDDLVASEERQTREMKEIFMKGADTLKWKEEVEKSLYRAKAKRQRTK